MPSNLRLDWKWPIVANTLTYCGTEFLTAVKKLYDTAKEVSNVILKESAPYWKIDFSLAEVLKVDTKAKTISFQTY